MEWLKKLGRYAPDIAAAIMTGGTSTIATTALRIVSRELSGSESSDPLQVATMVDSATTDQLLALTQANNEFKLEKMRIEAHDKQMSHKETQDTIRNSDNSQYKLNRMTRPLQSTACLAISAGLAFMNFPPAVFGPFLMITGTYMGLREFGKWKVTDAIAQIQKITKGL